MCACAGDVSELCSGAAEGEVWVRDEDLLGLGLGLVLVLIGHAIRIALLCLSHLFVGLAAR